jgi:patatin-related protein
MSPRTTSELRLALSMRGGVSLAVWIGGALQELDAFTRIRSLDYDPATQVGPPEFYPALLRLGGYDRAVIDVVTGASAGGLNGVVLAASRVYGFHFSEMLRVWVEMADIELLTRSPYEKTLNRATGREERRPESLLRGDGHFLAELNRSLAELVQRGSPERKVDDPFDLILSATLLNPAYETRDEDPFAPIEEVRRNAYFHFRYFGETGDNGGDFQDVDLAVDVSKPTSTVSLLALAGRATSSFPIAF